MIGLVSFHQPDNTIWAPAEVFGMQISKLGSATVITVESPAAGDKKKLKVTDDD